MHPLSADEVVQHIESGHRVFIHTAAAAPQILLDALTKRHKELKNVQLISAHTEGEASYAKAEYSDSFHIECFFSGHNIRQHVQNGRAHYIPIFLSEVPYLFRTGRMKLDVALLTLSPPNKEGYCSLGCSIDISQAAVESANIILAEINPNMPFTHGDGHIHISKLNAYCESDRPIFELQKTQVSTTEQTIGKHVASLVEDGATLQMGIGGIPNATLSFLHSHKNLGVHTEMCSDGLVELMQKGIVNNTQKITDKGFTVAGFAFGTRKLYDFIHENEQIQMRDVSYVNDTRIIRQNPKVTAINSAIEVDIWGQVCADSIGTKHYSGVGGQMDFIRGATLSEGGKGIIALPSRTSQGQARIVPMLKAGASVVTTRAHIQYIVTEYGVADLYGKTLQERAKQMVCIAHPDDRASISKWVYEHAHFHVD